MYEDPPGDPLGAAAFHKILEALDVSAQLPGQVFRGTWQAFRFFESDWLFVPEFAEALGDLMRREGSAVACMINVDPGVWCMHDPNWWIRQEQPESNVALLPVRMTPASYDDLLKRKGEPICSWLVGRGSFAIASDRGEWCIYCQSYDVAIIAFRHELAMGRSSAFLRRTSALSLEEHLALGGEGILGFDKLVPEWRRGLVENYSRR